MNEESRQFELLAVIGKGGFGTVYKAELTGAGGFSKLVAVKVLHSHLREIEEVAQRLRDEARLLGRLRHRAIVQVDGLMRLQGRWAVIMEYIEGVDLHELVSVGPVPLGPSLEVVQEVASALHVAYERPNARDEALRLLHRDIKPSNIRLTPAGEVKVMDFGLARADYESKEAVTGPLAFGTPSYLAPERLDRRPHSHASDVYALGCVLFALIAGQRFGKASANPDRHRARVQKGLNTIQDRVPHSIYLETVEATLAYDPERRPTARQLEQRLRDLRQKLPGQWLSDWAMHVVPAHMATGVQAETSHETVLEAVDNLTGSLLIEQQSQQGMRQLVEARTLILESSAVQPATPLSSPPPPADPTLPVVEEDDATVQPGSSRVPKVALLGGVVVVVALSLLLWGGSDESAPFETPAEAVILQTEVAEVPVAPPPVAEEPTGPLLESVEVEPAEPPPRKTPRPRAAKATPVPAPLPETGRVSVTGDASRVVLLDGGERHAVGPVSPGTYGIEATFGDGEPVGAGSVTVLADEHVTLVCDAVFFRCRRK